MSSVLSITFLMYASHGDKSDTECWIHDMKTGEYASITEEELRPVFPICRGMFCRAERLCIPYPATIDIFITLLWCVNTQEVGPSQVYYQITWDFFWPFFDKIR